MARKKKRTAAKPAVQNADHPELKEKHPLPDEELPDADFPEDVPETADEPEDAPAEYPEDNRNDDYLPDADDLTEDGAEPEADEPNAEKDSAAADSDSDEAPQEQYTMRTLVTNVKGLLARYQLPDMLLPRLLTLYFLLSGCWIVYFKHKHQFNPISNWRDFAVNVGGAGIIISFAVALLAGFLALSCFTNILPKKWQIADQSLGILSILFFDCCMLWRANNFFLVTGTTFVTLVFIYYLINKLPSRKPYEQVPWTFSGLICLGALALVTYFIIRGTVAKHRLFGTACHDFGLFVQMFYSLSHSLSPMTTAERDTLVSHFHVHASYIYYLLVTFYKIFKSETVLLWAQGILAAGGAVPMFLIAKRRNFKGIALIGITFMYIFSIAIVSPCFYDFHENAFLPTLLMWFFYAIELEKPVFSWIMAALVCIVKEDAPLYIICIGLFLFFEKKGRKMRWHGIAMTFVSGVYMLLITKWLSEHGDGNMMASIRFGLLMVNSEKGLGEVIKNTLLDPAYFFSLLIHEDTLNFFMQTMLPLLFLPFLTKKLHRFWLMVPMIVMNLVIGAGYHYAADMEFHYVFGPICLLFYMSMLNLEDLGEQKKHDLAILAGSAAILFFVGMPLHYWDNVETYAANKSAFQAVEDALDTIPRDASVSATPFYVGHIAERDEIYLYDMNDVDEAAQTINDMDSFDFFVFGPNTDIGNFTAPILERNRWEVFAEVPERVIIYKNPNYPRG